MRHGTTQFNTFSRTLLIGGGFLVLVGGANAQAKAFGGATSNVKRPNLMFGATAEEVGKTLGGAANATTIDSGWSLNLVLERPVARELVWAYDLTDPMPLTFNREGWLLNAPEKRTVRMYYHMGFDAAGKAVAGCWWYHGPVHPVPGRPGIPPPTRRPSIYDDSGFPYWNYSIQGIFKEVSGLDSETEVIKRARFTIWPYVLPSGRTAERAAKVVRARGNGETRQVKAARNPDGSYGPSGWMMAEGVSGNSTWYAVGRHYLVEQQPVGWYLEIDGITERAFGVTDIVLYLEVEKGNVLPRGKIVPTTNDKAVNQNGVK